MVKKHLVQVSDDPEPVKQICKALKKPTLESFEQMSKRRGQIVHDGRYQDYELGRTDTLHLLYSDSDEESLRGPRIIHDDVYRTKRRSVAQAITDSGDGAEQRVEQVFRVLDALAVPDQSGRGLLGRD